jgi:hypothetical protein
MLMPGVYYLLRRNVFDLEIWQIVTNFGNFSEADQNFVPLGY